MLSPAIGNTSDALITKGMVLSLENVHKAYGKRTIVRGVNLSVAQGEIVGLLRFVTSMISRTVLSRFNWMDLKPWTCVD